MLSWSWRSMKLLLLHLVGFHIYFTYIILWRNYKSLPFLVSFYAVSTNWQFHFIRSSFFNFDVPCEIKDNAEGQEVYCGLSSLQCLGWYGINPRSSGNVTDQKNKSFEKSFKRRKESVLRYMWEEKFWEGCWVHRDFLLWDIADHLKVI
jgi:hypothetical protein